MARRTLEDELNDDPRSRRRKRSRERGEESPIDRGRRKSRWPYFLIFLLILVLLLPNLIGWFGLQQKAIDWAMKDFNGKLAVEKVSMGWFQPIELTNVSGVDVQGNPLFQVDTVKSSKPLYSFLTSSEYGQLDVIKPVAYVQLRPDGSNLEDAFANYIAAEDDANSPETENTDLQSTDPLPRLKLNLTEGLATVTAADTGETWQIDQLNLIAETSASTAPLTLDAQCRVTPVSVDATGQTVLQNSGGLTLSSQFDSGTNQLTFGAADVLLQTQNIPVSLAAPVLRRVVGPASTTGNLSGKIQAAYNAATTSVALNVEQLNMDQFAIRAPDLIGQDTIAIQSLTANGQIQASPKIVSAEQFTVKSNVGRINAQGSFDVNQLANLAANPNSPNLLDTPFQMDGEVDLAQLIRMLPNTLQLHKDLAVNSGNVKFTAASRNENGQRRMVVNVDTANLNANRGGQSIVWAKPLRLVGTIHENQGRMQLEDVRCESDFLTVEGSADLETGSFVAKGDLAEMMKRVSQFVDLQGTQLAGKLDGKFGWQIETQNGTTSSMNQQALPIQIGGSFVVQQPVIQMSGLPRWQQDQMSVKFSATGQSQPEQLYLAQGGVQVDIGNEKLVATIADPILDVYTQSTWNANCQATGSFRNWLGHVRNFVDIGEFESDGNLTATCAASLTSDAIQLTGLQYEIAQLGFDGYGMKIRDPQVKGTANVHYDLKTGDILIPQSSLSSQSVSATGQQLSIRFPGNMRVDGAVNFKADMNRVADWYQLSPTPESVHWYGEMQGQVQLASNEHGIGGRLGAVISNLVAAQQVAAVQPQLGQQDGQGQMIQAAQTQRAWQEIWRENKIGVNGDLSFANDFNAMAFQNVVIDSPSLRATTQGTLSDLAGSMVADLQGTWNPNWEKLNSLLAGYTGDMVNFQGQGERQYVVKGPVFTASTQPGAPQPWIPPQLQIATNVGWDSGEIMNLPVGQSQIDINVQQSVAFLQTSGIPFAGGAVKFAPQIDMRGEEPVVVMEATRVIDNVELKPETARQWLKYVAPLAADATSAQGNFTVDLGGIQLPVFNPTNVKAQGAVHLSNVVVGAGPAADQLLATVKQLRGLLKPGSQDRDMRTWLQMDQQTVPFEVRDGRVFHENLKFSHKDLTVQTKGSVGIDQTLNMVAMIPIHEDWIKDKPYLEGLKGQSLSVPITGTVSKPILDRSALQQFSRDLAKQAAGSAINKVIGDKLTPKVDQFRNEFNDKIGNELNGLQNKFREKLGGSLFPQNGNGAAPAGEQLPSSGQAPQPIQKKIGDKLEDELKKGIGNLFGK